MLEAEGLLPGCRCALCHKEQEDGDFGEVSLQRSLELTPDAATNRGLGPLLLVKVSAIANAWVHSQCAVWCPEVRSFCCCPSNILVRQVAAACMWRFLRLRP